MRLVHECRYSHAAIVEIADLHLGNLGWKRGVDV